MVQQHINAPRIKVGMPPGLEGIDCLQKGQDDYDALRELYASFAGSHPTEDFEPFFAEGRVGDCPDRRLLRL
jgi:hypothetical protein